jgi:AcrR family transcriptional regulator
MNDSTKGIILKKSHKLFADKGFNGVSVREIAKECDVNIAAINYHFKNKENLYIETIRSSMQQTESDIHKKFDELEDKNIVSISLSVFNHFRENAEDLRTGFKLIISSDKYHEAIGGDISKFKGPPGGEYFSKCLVKEFPKATQEDIEWAVRTIFTQVIHKAIILCNHSICESMKEMGMGEDLFEKDLLRLVKVVKNELSS